MVQVKWMPGAIADLNEIGEFIARDDPDAADRVTQHIWDIAHGLGRLPRKGYPVSGLEGEEIRQLDVGLYRIAYRVVGGMKAERVEILAIAHARQQRAHRKRR